MKKVNTFILLLFSLIIFSQNKNSSPVESQKKIKLGAFSMSLNVKNLQESKIFYKKLGFSVTGGNEKQNYLILKNENTVIGIFQGMFQGNMLTFNPGWDENGKNTETFDDVREIQKILKKDQIILDREADEKTSGLEYIICLLYTSRCV